MCICYMILMSFHVTIHYFMRVLMKNLERLKIKNLYNALEINILANSFF
jgi:hypothetical protein